MAEKKRRSRIRENTVLAAMLSGDTMRFPKPGPHPEGGAESDDWIVRVFVFMATHTNDPETRAMRAETAAKSLIAGDPLSAPLRQWLAWVLARLVATNTVPHLARGNACKRYERLETVLELARLMSQPSGDTVVKRLDAASERLNISLAQARALYYGEACKVLMKSYRERAPVT